MNATFRFAVGNFVTTPFGQRGIISMAAVDKAGTVYFVKTAQTSEWFDEGQLKAAEHVQPDEPWPRA